MKDQCWEVQGVHEGKLLSVLPITYLLWFVGSPVMRRVRWECCRIALLEVNRRLLNGTALIEAELLDDLRPREKSQRLEIKVRRQGYRQSLAARRN